MQHEPRTVAIALATTVFHLVGTDTLVQLGRNISPVTRTISHRKTRAFPRQTGEAIAVRSTSTTTRFRNVV